MPVIGQLSALLNWAFGGRQRPAHLSECKLGTQDFPQLTAVVYRS